MVILIMVARSSISRLEDASNGTPGIGSKLANARSTYVDLVAKAEQEML